MARAVKLKVFRTPIGFHDAYVAVPSQKAATEAWGSGGDLFARGEAELVTDPALTAEPLANPGKVIKRLRGTAEEQLAALPPDRPRRAARKTDEPDAAEPAPRRARPPKKQAPRPSRRELDAAEAALEEAEERQSREREALAEREAELARERRAMERAHARERDRLERARADTAEAYEAAMKAWRE